MNTKFFKPLFQLLFVVLVFFLAFELRDIAIDNEHVQSFIEQFGYFGIMVISIIGGLNIFVPIPAIAFLPAFLAVDLNIIMTVFIIALGTTIGDGISFFLGNAGRALVRTRPETKTAQWLELFHGKWYKKYPKAPLIILFFFASFVPFPNEALIVPLAFLGYKFRRMLPWLLLGNIVFNTLAATGIATLVTTPLQ